MFRMSQCSSMVESIDLVKVFIRCEIDLPRYDVYL